MSVSLQTWDKIKAFKKGNFFCVNDFDDIRTRGHIDVILHRLSGNVSIQRLGYGLYDISLRGGVTQAAAKPHLGVLKRKIPNVYLVFLFLILN